MRYFAVILLCFTVFSCKKAEDRTCWKFAGSETSLEVPMENADHFILRSKLNYLFVQDSANKIVVKGGKNLVNLVKIMTNPDGSIEISNENKCGFLRKHGNWVDVEIHFTTLRDVMFTGSDLISGSVKSDTLALVVNHGTGTINMKVESTVLTAKALEGFGNFTLTGHVSSAQFYATSNAYCNTDGLTVTDSVTVWSNTTSYMKVNADGAKLIVSLLSKGDVIYKGNPSSLNLLRTGTGAVYQGQ